MSKLPIEYLRHIYDECDFITTSIPPEAVKDDLLDDEVLKRAVIRSLEIIGEATKKYQHILNSSGRMFLGKTLPA